MRPPRSRYHGSSHGLTTPSRPAPTSQVGQPTWMCHLQQQQTMLKPRTFSPPAGARTPSFCLSTAVVRTSRSAASEALSLCAPLQTAHKSSAPFCNLPLNSCSFLPYPSPFCSHALTIFQLAASSSLSLVTLLLVCFSLPHAAELASKCSSRGPSHLITGGLLLSCHILPRPRPVHKVV